MFLQALEKSGDDTSFDVCSVAMS